MRGNHGRHSALGGLISAMGMGGVALGQTGYPASQAPSPDAPVSTYR